MFCLYRKKWKNNKKLTEPYFPFYKYGDILLINRIRLSLSDIIQI